MVHAKTYHLESVIFLILVVLVLACSSQATSVEDVIFDIDHNLKNHYPIDVDKVNSGEGQTYSIAGAGPVGLYLALRLLEENPRAKVELYEARSTFTRTQCLRLPYDNARKLPEKLKSKLWPDDKVRDTIFSNKKSSDLAFWPHPNYQHYPRIAVGNFQTHLLAYLKTSFADRFAFHNKEVKIKEVSEWLAESNNPVFITSGALGLNNDVRDHLRITEKFENSLGKNDYDEFGLYLIYNNSKPEYYEKTSREKLGAHGLTYSATNNEYSQVQFYTYPKETFIPYYSNLPFVCRDATFPKAIEFYNTSAKFAWKDESIGLKWLDDFKKELESIASKYEIQFPKSAKLHCAPRKEYAFYKSISKDYPVVFFGDSVGGTDFKYGLNLGRGLLEVDFFVENLKKKSFSDTAILYQQYWDEIIAKEFNSLKNNITDLIADPWIFFKYVVLGRNVDDVLRNESTFSDYEKLFSKKQTLINK